MGLSKVAHYKISKKSSNRASYNPTTAYHIGTGDGWLWIHARAPTKPGPAALEDARAIAINSAPS